MYGMDVWFEQVKSMVGPEMKQDLLLFCWNWRPRVAVDWLESILVDVDFLNLAAIGVDTKGGGTEERLDERRTRGVAELREETSRRGAIPMGARGGLGVNREILYLGASACSREADSDQVRYRFNGLGRGDPSQLVSEQEISEMADRRDWGGGGDDPEESTQRMIERIWESLTDIRARMDQQAPVPPVAVPPGDGEAVPVAPVPPRVEVVSG
ncbi:hypothetical protein Taro_010065 [Colocasia esculenta]|uniref:Uncharacterized protein n=1 Tax=Colocasia esculenta TaxID=4460 RepID=A0A843U1Z8_COLES|nr:hypothetical protein [Colocasia esculenta]